MSNDVSKRATPAPVNIPDTDLTNSQIEDQLITARIQMLLDAPFYGTLACRLKFIDATQWCPTAATDGRNFYYNRNFVAALSNPEQVFLMGHEVEHCVYDHMGRRGNRDPGLWNIANDYIVNADLIEAGIGQRIRLVEILHDPQYAGMTSDEVYDLLFQQAKEEGRVINLSTLDMHLEPDDGTPGGSEGDQDGGNDGSLGPIRYSEEERRQIQEEFRNATIDAAKAAAGAGNLPGGIKRLLDDLLNPQLDWRELLTMQIQSTVRSDYTWMRPSRKGQDAGFYLPGMDREQTIDVAIAIDTSGSISEEMLRDFLSEVYGIMSQYNDFTVHLWCFDTGVHNPVKITADAIAEFEQYQLAGFGGTDFEVNWEYMKDHGIAPKKFIMFTDGYPFGGWGDETYCDTLFIVHGGGYGREVPQAPFGITVPYTREEA